MDEDIVVVNGVCVLCGRELPRREGQGVPAIGVCAACAMKHQAVPVEDLRDLSEEEIERLPFGYIRVDPNGIVRRFNSYEVCRSGLAPEQVVGRHFFQEVAPCTAVRDFAGRYERMVREGRPAAESFRYVFRFSGGERLVKIFLSYRPDKREGLIIVRELSAL